MKGYDSYKNSGVEWIGEIPNHWDISKYKFAVNILSGFPFKSELFNKDKGFPLIRIRDISSGSVETFYDGDYPEDYIVKKGDLLVGMDGDFNIRWWNNVDALLNQRCCSIKSIKEITVLRFLFYVIPNDLQIINDLAYYTTVKHLSNSDLYNRSLILPSLEEQTAIASFLDYKTNLIDATIEKKKRLIDLLKEKRQAVINEAVTKGLNPNAPMKDSGVEWLGEIPEHWKIKKLKYSVDFISEKASNINRGIALEDITSWTGQGNLRDTSHFEGDLILFEKGDVLFNKLRPYLAKVYMANEDGGAVGELMVLRPKQDVINQTFLFNRLISKGFIDVVDGSTYGAKMPRASVSFILDLKFGVPPIKEQIAINSYINNIIDTSNKLSKKLEIVIEKLQTYRQSLISEAVTGKIDVRDWEITKN